MTIRSPVSPGRFYPHDALLLLQQVEACYYHPLGPGGFPSTVERDQAVKSGQRFSLEKAPVALMVPHGALGHSGPIAAHAYALLAACAQFGIAKLPELIVVVGPDHLGNGPAVSATTMSYSTPLGVVPTADTLVRQIYRTNQFQDAPSGHINEHSVENQIPFLQHLAWRLTVGSNVLPPLPMELPSIPSIIPLTMASQEFATAMALAALLDNVLPDSGVLLLVTSDMSHCGPLYANVPFQEPPSNISIAQWCTQQTEQAVNAITTMSPMALREAHESGLLSMCGVGCVLTAMEFARRRGATSARLLAMSSSVDVASSWVGHLPTDQRNNVQSPWELLVDVDARNPVGFASIAFI